MPFNGYFTCYIIMQVEKGKIHRKRERKRERQRQTERMCHTMFDALK